MDDTDSVSDEPAGMSVPYLQDTIETYDLGVSTWADAGGRSNPILYDEENAIVMVTYGDSYDVVNVATVEEIVDAESLAVESDVLQEYAENDAHQDSLADMFRGLTDHTNIASYLNEQDVVIDGVNDGLLDRAQRYLARRGEE